MRKFKNFLSKGNNRFVVYGFIAGWIAQSVGQAVAYHSLALGLILCLVLLVGVNLAFWFIDPLLKYTDDE